MFYRKHERVTAPEGGPLMTEQSHKDACDIHNILRQFRRTGVIEHIARQQPRFEDLPVVQDFQVALEIVMQADQAFAALPARLRDRFENDPEMFLRALGDPSNEQEFRELGILKPKFPSGPAAGSTEPPAS